MLKRSASLALVACLSGGLVFVAAPQAGALSGTETCFFNKINAERANVGRSKLVAKGDLTSVARNHSKDMAADGTIYHNGNLKNEVGGNWWALGENVGMGPGCDSLHNAFMDSPGHKANVLDKDYNQIGVGAVMEEGTIYVTMVFAGRPSGSAPKPKVTAKPKPAAAPPKPKPVPKPPVAEARTMSIMLVLLGMDAARVDPTSGEAMGV
ncbi:MAG: CAP domain-containing protein [Actinomycetota bacterium]